jgi:hypothetical protein
MLPNGTILVGESDILETSTIPYQTPKEHDIFKIIKSIRKNMRNIKKNYILCLHFLALIVNITDSASIGLS